MYVCMSMYVFMYMYIYINKHFKRPLTIVTKACAMT